MLSEQFSSHCISSDKPALQQFTFKQHYDAAIEVNSATIMLGKASNVCTSKKIAQPIQHVLCKY
jgi:hypothetical protein